MHPVLPEKSQRARLKIKKNRKNAESSLYHRHAVRVEIDENKIHEASIKEDWEVLKPESMIEHLEDETPEDWMEEKQIADTAAE